MAEKEDITWHQVFYPHELTEDAFPVNTLKMARIKGKRYCIAHTPHGFFAVDDTCPHAGGSLSHGWCDARGNIICPLHRYGFNAETGKNAKGAGPNTGAYATELKSDGLYIGLVRKKWSFW